MTSRCVEENEGGLSTATFPGLLSRKRPLVIRGAAQMWCRRSVLFSQEEDVRALKTRWRVHAKGKGTVWESECQFVDATVRQMLEWQGYIKPRADSSDNPFAPFDNGSTYWAYADYKHVKELAADWTKVLEPIINWPSLGCAKRAADSTVWVGTPGCHTPLHYDTYGVNLVAQLEGSKKWVLYSPDDAPNLYPTRVPYEESSVFSRADARAPDLNRFPRLAEARPLSVTLEEGDVLYVPKHWWHFVEVESLSLSVNVWVDAPDDSEDRTKEALARLVVTSLAGELENEVGPGWLNPTEKVWSLEDTLDAADIALQALETSTTGESDISPEHRFSVRELVDTITAPDILSKLLERYLLRRRMDAAARENAPSPR